MQRKRKFMDSLFHVSHLGKYVRRRPFTQSHTAGAALNINSIQKVVTSAMAIISYSY